MVITVASGGMRKVDLGELLEEVLEVLDHFITLIGDTHFSLAGSEARSRFLNIIPNYWTSTLEDDEAAHREIFEHFYICTLFSCAFHV